MENSGTEIVPVTLNDGQQFLMEVRNSGGREKVADIGALPTEDLMQSISSLSSSIVQSVKKAGPSRFAVEFGVEVALKSGKLFALLCNGEGRANLKVTLEWNNT